MKKYCDVSKLSVRKISKSVAKDIIVKNHYSHLWTKVSHSLGLYIEDDSHQFFNSSEKLIGVICYGDPIGRLSGQSISPLLERTEVLELVRVFIFDDYGSNIESWFIGQSFKWLREKYRGYELENKIIGIIGYGHTGKSFAKKLSGFNNIKVLFYDIKEIKTDKYAEKSSLEKIFKNADILSFHVNENDLSIKMFNKSFIKKMRKPFWIINTSRGKIVSLEDLKWGIEKDIIIGAGLDVIELEDYSFEKITFEKNEILNFFLKSEKVIITPHIAGWTFESHHKLAKIIVDKISKYF